MEVTNPPSQSSELWQIDAAGKIYETSFEEMTQWIAEGSLLQQDKVKRGNLRWIEAGKVPSLVAFFNAKANGTLPPVITITNSTKPISNENIHRTNSNNVQITNSPNPEKSKNPKKLETLEEFKNNPDFLRLIEQEKQDNCLIHEFEPPKYVCEACSNCFCKACPKSYGERVKFCPMCGGILHLIEQIEKKQDEEDLLSLALKEGFGFKDFKKALFYSFKFPASLIFGAIIFVFCTIGQDASSLGGRWLISAAIMSGMLANTLTFGILANVVENMLFGRLNKNFMPSFDDFSIWDDVIQPFFLSLGVYLVSFGGLLILIVVMFYFVVQSISADPQKSVSTFVPEIQENYGASRQAKDQTEFFKDAVKKNNEEYQKRIQSMEQNRDSIDSPETTPIPANSRDEEQEFQQVNEMIKQTRKKQLESSIGQKEDSSEQPYSELMGKIQTWALPFSILAAVLFGWGLFYLPVAYIVAAYTRNFRSLFNPMVGLDTIKRLGFDYVKILFFGLILMIANGIVQIVLKNLLSSFDLPRLGNIPAQAIQSLFTFYFSIVFSVVLGFALFKNSDKFQMNFDNS